MTWEGNVIKRPNYLPFVNATFFYAYKHVSCNKSTSKIVHQKKNLQAK